MKPASARGGDPGPPVGRPLQPREQHIPVLRTIEAAERRQEMDRDLGGGVAPRIEPVEGPTQVGDGQAPGGGVRAAEVPGGVGRDQRVGVRGERRQALHDARIMDSAESVPAERQREERALVARGAQGRERAERRAAAGPSQRLEQLRAHRGVRFRLERAQERVLGGRVGGQPEREGRVGADGRRGIGERRDQRGHRRRILDRRERERGAGADHGIGIRQRGHEGSAVARVLGVDQPLEIGTREEPVGRTRRSRLGEARLADDGPGEGQDRDRRRGQSDGDPPGPGRDAWKRKRHGGRQDS